MALADQSVAVLVGLRPAAPVTAVPIKSGSPVRGATPAPVADWIRSGESFDATAVFGPYDVPVSFDAVRLMHGDEVMVDLPTGALPVNLNPSAIYELSLTISARVIS